MDGELPALDIDRIAEFPADFGDFSFESLTVRYDFTRDEYRAAMAAFPSTRELSEPLKTAIHETTHLLHSTTTPFGLFVYRVRGLQTRIVSDAILAVRSRGHDVTFPLQKTFRSLPRDAAGEVEWRLRLWYGLELIVLAMMGEADVFNTHIVNNRYVRGLTVAGLFAHAQLYFAQARGVPEAPIEALDPMNARAEASLFVGDLLLGGASTLAVIETAGTVSEYVASEHLNLMDFKARMQGASWMHTTVPKSWLSPALDHVRASTLPEFILSYLALCEVALFPPVLLEHRPLRTGAVKSIDILPFARWHRALAAAASVSPMTALTDYDRYTREICATAELTPPMDVVAASVNTADSAPPLDPRERAYLKAQLIRARGPGAFLDCLGMLGRLPPDLDFPVIQYTDRTLFLKDKVLLNAVVTGYLVRAVVRRMLLRPDLVVTMPYPPTPEESAFYARELTSMFEETLGMRVPGVGVAGPPQ
jgi:hypothetical protein